MNRWREIGRAFWQARTQRERIILLVSALLFALLILWFWIVMPALEGRAARQKNLLSLRAQQAQMQTLLSELKAAPVNNVVAAKSSTPLSRQFIESDLAAKGMKATSVSVSDELVTLTLTNTTFSSLLSWLQEIQRSTQLHLTQATVSALQEKDHVDVTLSLRQTR